MNNAVIELKLAVADTAITNAGADEGILELISRFAYTEERLKEGRNLRTAAGRLYQAQLDCKLAQYKAGEKLREILSNARAKHALYRRVSRIALQGQEHLKTVLALDGRSKRDLGGWMEEARLFYANALRHPGVREKLEGFGITREDLVAGRKLVDDVESAAAFHEMKKGKTIQATKKRDDAIKELDAWMKDFWEICRLALADTPEKMVKLKLRKNK
ncbi:MAG: hypothetical protein GY950_21875 [bacterium]|nr:hypothetical protein [bacterium]